MVTNDHGLHVVYVYFQTKTVKVMHYRHNFYWVTICALKVNTLCIQKHLQNIFDTSNKPKMAYSRDAFNRDF